ncbi:MAG TPA: metalloregulator ArsR/SmtB family transcription factor [Phycisphaerae bacterium]|nr:metalloregulator ArsR/SmtB family transcription factor [Phycisphaerae bacterium]HUU23877.1 metalloregulator ArsR/SmtB family transcription factor [Phycisphaerae bacterium]
MDESTKRLYELKAEVIQAAAHPIRLAVLDYLRDGEQCVCDIAAHVEAERSNVSRHLAVMTKAGLLESRKDGLKVMYSIRCGCILNFLACVTDVLREQLEDQNAMLGKLTK